MELSNRYSTPVPLLKKVITRKHFVELLAENQINPRGEDRKDLRAAMICTTIARGFGNKKAKLSDFQLKFDSHKKKKMSKEEASSFLGSIANFLKRNEGK